MNEFPIIETNDLILRKLQKYYNINIFILQCYYLFNIIKYFKT